MNPNRVDADATHSTAPDDSTAPVREASYVPSNRTESLTDDDAESDRPRAGAVFPGVLFVAGEYMDVDDILEPIEPQLTTLAAEYSPETYYTKAVELVRRQIIEEVAQRLIWHRAKDDIDDDTKPRLDKAVDQMERERINREFQGREATYTAHLARRDTSRADVRERLRRAVVIETYLRERLVSRIPSPRRSELTRYYRDHIAEFTTPAKHEMWLIDIPIAAFFDFSRPLSPDDEVIAQRKAREAIDAAAADLRAGVPFEDVARKYSHGVNKDNGGHWGIITSPLQGRWAAAYETLVTLGSNQSSGIIEASKAYFIVHHGSGAEATVVSFEDAQPRIIERIRQERFNRLRSEFLQRELERATIGDLEKFAGVVMAACPKPA